MNTDREMDEILAEIGREHREVGAPHKLESVLRRAASSRKDAVGGPGLHAAIKWAVAVVLLVVVAAAGVRWHGRRSDASRDQPVRSVPEPEVKADPPAERVLAPSRPAARPARSGRPSCRRTGTSERSTIPRGAKTSCSNPSSMSRRASTPAVKNCVASQSP